MNPIFLALFGFLAAAFGGGSSSNSAAVSGSRAGKSPDDGIANDPTASGDGTTDSGDGTTDSGDGTTASGTIPQTSGQTSNTSGGEIPPADISSTFEVAGGRVTTLQVENHEAVENIRILSRPDHGNLSVNPDNTLALVMSHEHTFSGSIDFTYEVTYSDGSTQVMSNTANVQPSTQGDGWGQGNFYMLEEDEHGDVVVEYGDNHREVYVSGSNNALSLADIASIEGLSTSQITGRWLAEHPEYGNGPDMALDSEAGMRLWYEITGEGTEPSSHWLLFERGYEYDNLGSVVAWGTIGEDPLHPVHITAYGEGDKPVLNTRITQFSDQSENIVISDLAVTSGMTSVGTSHLILEDMEITNNPNISGSGMGLMIDRGEGITVRDSTITDVYWRSPPDGGSSWSGYEQASGMIMGYNDGVLIEGMLFDHNGFAPDYDPNLSTSGGQPPSYFSHNVYIDWNNTDVTFRDNITMRSGGGDLLKIRSGGFIEDNVIADGNNSTNFAGGDWNNRTGQVGNYTLFADNVLTSAGYRETDTTGWLSHGVENDGMDSTLLDNIIAHLADPDNPDELAEKDWANPALRNLQDPFYDDTIVYNWAGALEEQPDRNVDGLDTNVLDITTIQRFAQQLLGDPNAGIPELADFLRAHTAADLDHYADADLIIDFFQTGFGLAVEDRLSAETLRFVPNDLGDGIRWDNRLNWSTEDLPGAVEGDSVDLGGNWVNYGGTTTIDDLEFGEGGTLNVGHGRLNVTGQTTAGSNGGTIDIFNTGQVWMEDYTDTDDLSVNVGGGRFANTGVMSGVDLNATDGQAILATDDAEFDVLDGNTLSISGAAKAGFDGENGGLAILDLHAGAILALGVGDGDLGEIGEFRSGAFGDAPNVDSGIDLGGSTLEIDLSGLTAEAGNGFTLMSADELTGLFGDAVVGGLGARNANIVIDYVNDTVTLQLSSGNGAVTVETVGEESDVTAGAEHIWDALTTGQGVFSETQMAQETIVEEDLVDAAA